MQNESDQDISGLCEWAGINTQNYLHFARKRADAPQPESVPSVDISHRLDEIEMAAPLTDTRQIIHPTRSSASEPLDEEREALVVDAEVNEVARTADSPRVHSSGVSSHAPVEIRSRLNKSLARKSANRGERWLGLQAALDESSAIESGTVPHQTSNLLLFPSSGGVGVTTLAATLSRVYSGQRSSVGIIENSYQSLIPMHFGAKGSRSGCTTFVVSRSCGSAPLHLISPKSNPESLISYAGTLGRHSESEDWVEDGLKLVGNECDYLMVDTWAGMSIGLLSRMARNSCCVVPILPDVRSTLRIRPILEVFQNLSTQTGYRMEPHFLLTKFDHNISLHTDLRKWLGDQLKSRLMPVVLRRGDEVSEALAEGETIIDYAPNSGLTEDFQRLAEWLKARFHSSEVTAHHRAAVAGD